jgi:SOS response regulatory protein OraA/RecX
MNIVQSALISNKELIENAVEEDDLLIKDFEKLLKKYDKNEYEDKNKIIKSLMSKGYNYQLIKKLFE